VAAVAGWFVVELPAAEAMVTPATVATTATATAATVMRWYLMVPLSLWCIEEWVHRDAVPDSSAGEQACCSGVAASGSGIHKYGHELHRRSKADWSSWRTQCLAGVETGRRLAALGVRPARNSAAYLSRTADQSRLRPDSRGAQLNGHRYPREGAAA